MKNKEIKRRFKQECFTPQCEKNIEQYGEPKENLHSSYLAIDWMCEQFKSPWIKCSERMPEENDKGLSESVLTITGEGWICVNFTIDGKWVKVKGVLAWMPIPKYEEE